MGATKATHPTDLYAPIVLRRVDEDQQRRNITLADWGTGTFGNNVSVWGGRYLDVRSPAVREVQRRRLEWMAGIGCDGVDPGERKRWLVLRAGCRGASRPGAVGGTGWSRSECRTQASLWLPQQQAARPHTTSLPACPLSPDNTDIHWANTGFNLTRGDLIDYIRFITGTAHAYGMAAGLKNAADLLPDVEASVDWCAPATGRVGSL